MTYSDQEVNAALERVEAAKQEHPIGWRFLAELGIDPPDEFVLYAFQTAEIHARRMGDEDRSVIYAAGWLQGLAVGVALEAGERAP